VQFVGGLHVGEAQSLGRPVGTCTNFSGHNHSCFLQRAPHKPSRSENEVVTEEQVGWPTPGCPSRKTTASRLNCSMGCCQFRSHVRRMVRSSGIVATTSSSWRGVGEDPTEVKSRLTEVRVWDLLTQAKVLIIGLS